MPRTAQNMPVERTEDAETERRWVFAVYIAYLLSLVGMAIAPLVGVIIAYARRGDVSDWLVSHYTFQIRTFWGGFIASMVGILLLNAFVGFIVITLAALWFLGRSVKGMVLLSRYEPHPDPETYWM